MMRGPRSAALALVVILFTPLPGCGGQAPAPPKAMDRVDAIVKSSGGDWDKVAPADRDYLINVVGKGSPISAQMTFRARAGGLKPGAKVHH